MLYKKYHRNYIRKFRKGVKFNFFNFKLVEVTREPYSFENCIFISTMICSSKRDLSWKLIGNSGFILYKIEFIS